MIELLELFNYIPFELKVILLSSITLGIIYFIKEIKYKKELCPICQKALKNQK
jgi:hypothetical protein